MLYVHAGIIPVNGLIFISGKKKGKKRRMRDLGALKSAKRVILMGIDDELYP